MNDYIKLFTVFFLAGAVGVGTAMLLEAIASPDAVPTVEEADTDDLTAGRYHQRTRTNDFFRRRGG